MGCSLGSGHWGEVGCSLENGDSEEVGCSLVNEGEECNHPETEELEELYYILQYHFERARIIRHERKFMIM